MSMLEQRGAVTIVAVAGTLIMCLFSLAAADLGAMLHARARAQAAADAAALAAAVAQAPILGRGDDPEAAAREVAEANGVTLLSCACTTGGSVATVEVQTAARPILIAAWSSRRIRARASAEVDPDVFSYRDG